MTARSGIHFDVALPEKLAFLLEEQARYKVAYGGRDSTKSWSFARALLVRGVRRPMRWLCARETQASVDESVHRLLSDQIKLLGLGSYYTIQRTRILGPGGTEFGYAGLRHNIDELKSWEGADGVWVEEANNVSRTSWNTLIFTIRKAGSEIWVSFNPELETDETYQRFVVKPPPGAIVAHMTYRDNPWPSLVLVPDREAMERDHPDDYGCIWDGLPRESLQEAIYADEIRAMVKEKRETQVPVEPQVPIDTYWDLGHANNTSIWFVQKVGFQYRVVDHLRGNLKKIGWYVGELQGKKYIYSTHYLPPDARSEQLGAESIENQLKALMPSVPVDVLDVAERSSLVHGINAVKTIFPLCWFDKERCADGLQGLRHYRYKKDARGVVTREPLHDWASDDADAFRTFALCRNRGKKTRPGQRQTVAPRYVQASGTPGQAWMGG